MLLHKLVHNATVPSNNQILSSIRNNAKLFYHKHHIKNNSERNGDRVNSKNYPIISVSNRNIPSESVSNSPYNNFVGSSVRQMKHVNQENKMMTYNSKDYESKNLSKDKLNESIMIYIAEFTNNDIKKCQITDYKLFNCSTVLNYGLYGPEGLLIVNNYLYILNFSKASTVKCYLKDDGYLANCVGMNIPIQYPSSISYSQQKIYINNFSGEQIECALLDDGALDNCQLSDAGDDTIFERVEFKGYYYSMEQKFNNIITKCKLANNICTPMNNEFFNIPETILIINNSAYFSNYNANNIVKCTIQNDGGFTSCSVVESGLGNPVGMSVWYKLHSH